MPRNPFERLKGSDKTSTPERVGDRQTTRFDFSKNTHNDAGTAENAAIISSLIDGGETNKSYQNPYTTYIRKKLGETKEHFSRIAEKVGTARRTPYNEGYIGTPGERNHSAAAATMYADMARQSRRDSSEEH